MEEIFVTGASGFIGSAVVQELLSAGYRVLGLARSEETALALTAAGAKVHRGSLDDLDSLRRAAAQADGVIHLAYGHDFSKSVEAGQADKAAIEALGAGLAGTEKPLVVSAGLAGLAGLAQRRLVTEEDQPAPLSRMSEPAGLAQAERGVRAMVVRLAPSVHGAGDSGFVPFFIQLAREKGTAAYLGEGQNRWSAIHRLDAARLFRLALEKGPARSIFHGVADEGVPMRDIAALIGERLGVPVVSKTSAEADAHFGWLAPFAGGDRAASSALTQQQLGWQPAEPDLLTDMRENGYFS